MEAAEDFFSSLYYRQTNLKKKYICSAYKLYTFMFQVEQLHKIFKLCGSPSEDYWSKLHLRQSTVMKPPQPYRRCVMEAFKEFPAPAVQLVETLLAVDPANRGTAALALKSEVCICF